VKDQGLDDADGATTELTSVDQHPGDVGSELFEREKDIAIADNFGEQINEVKDALQRLDGENFGRCEVCNEQIGDDRLEAVPWTRYCIKHQETVERTA
jgi:RNA polymerase-binding transcription factor DksA